MTKALLFPWGWTLAVALGQANTTGHMPLFIQWVTSSLCKDFLTPCFGFGFSQEMDILEPRNYVGRHVPNGKDRSSLNQRVPKEPLLSRGDGC